MADVEMIAAPKAQVNPMDILHQAVERGVDIEQLTALMGLQERWQANQAKIAFREAMATFKQNPPTILKNQHVKFGNTEYDHATLDNVTAAITTGLSAVGITHSFKIKQDGGTIGVTCILSKGVHSEETTLVGSPDASGAKNAIQAIGSSVTYLQRYTLLAATGVATGLPDDDAKPQIDPEQLIIERIKLIEESANLEQLQDRYKEGYRLAAKDEKVKQLYIDAKNRRKAQLEKEMK